MNQPWDVHGAQVGDCHLQGTVRPPVPRLKGLPALEGLCVWGGWLSNTRVSGQSRAPLSS